MEISLRSVLSTDTRKERSSVLVASFTAMAIGGAEIVPKEITALGVKFSAEDRAILLWVLGVAVVFLLVEFCLHMTIDVKNWYESYCSEIESLEEQLRVGGEDAPAVRARLERAETLLKQPTTILLGLFELTLPVVAGIAAILVLITTRVGVT